jgi:hypothetical protein
MMRVISLLTFFATSIVTHAATINDLADNIIYQLYAGNKMIVLMAYVSGLGFLVISFFKFKQHKDNPAQNPVGNALTILLIGVLLIYLGSLSKPLGETFFGAKDGPDTGVDLIK